MRFALVALLQLLLCQPCLAWSSTEERLGQEVYARAQWALEHVLSTSYRHNRKTADEQVEENARTGELSAATDSSGFLSWALFGVSPGHLFAVQGDKDTCPQATEFAKFFASIPRRDIKDGWLNVPSALELQRGDVIAFGTVDARGKEISGQAMIVASQASEVKTTTIDGQEMRYITVRVIDSSPIPHFAPETLPPLVNNRKRNGIGEGEVRIFVDSHGKPIAISLGENDRQFAQAQDQKPIFGLARVIGPAKLQEASSEYLQYEPTQWHSRRGKGPY